MKTKPGIEDLKDGQRVVSEDQEKSAIINRYFTSVFVEEQLSNIPQLRRQQAGPSLSYKKLRSMKML